jgi:hypothetical protein
VSVMSKASSLIMFVVSPVGTDLSNVGQRIKILAITVALERPAGYLNVTFLLPATVNSPTFKTGHCEIQLRPLGVETGQYQFFQFRVSAPARSRERERPGLHDVWTRPSQAAAGDRRRHRRGAA